MAAEVLKYKIVIPMCWSAGDVNYAVERVGGKPGKHHHGSVLGCEMTEDQAKELGGAGSRLDPVREEEGDGDGAV